MNVDHNYGQKWSPEGTFVHTNNKLYYFFASFKCVNALPAHWTIVTKSLYDVWESNIPLQVKMQMETL